MAWPSNVLQWLVFRRVTPLCAMHPKVRCVFPSGSVQRNAAPDGPDGKHIPLVSAPLPPCPPRLFSPDQHTVSPICLVYSLSPCCNFPLAKYTHTPPGCLFLWNACIPQLLRAWCFLRGRLGMPEKLLCICWVERERLFSNMWYCDVCLPLCVRC